MEQTIGPKQLRTFGCVLGGIFSLIAIWPAFMHGQSPRWWSLTFAVPVVLIALVAPQRLAPIHRWWMRVGTWMGWVNTRLILAVGFFGLVTPIAVVRRIFGRDSMRRRFDADLPTYRVLRPARPGDHLFRQY